MLLNRSAINDAEINGSTSKPPSQAAFVPSVSMATSASVGGAAVIGIRFTSGAASATSTSNGVADVRKSFATSVSMATSTSVGGAAVIGIRFTSGASSATSTSNGLTNVRKSLTPSTTAATSAVVGGAAVIGIRFTSGASSATSTSNGLTNVRKSLTPSTTAATSAVVGGAVVAVIRLASGAASATSTSNGVADVRKSFATSVSMATSTSVGGAAVIGIRFTSGASSATSTSNGLTNVRKSLTPSTTASTTNSDADVQVEISCTPSATATGANASAIRVTIYHPLFATITKGTADTSSGVVRTPTTLGSSGTEGFSHGSLLTSGVFRVHKEVIPAAVVTLSSSQAQTVVIRHVYVPHHAILATAVAPSVGLRTPTVLASGTNRIDATLSTFASTATLRVSVILNNSGFTKARAVVESVPLRTPTVLGSVANSGVSSTRADSAATLRVDVRVVPGAIGCTTGSSTGVVRTPSMLSSPTNRISVSADTVVWGSHLRVQVYLIPAVPPPTSVSASSGVSILIVHVLFPDLVYAASFTPSSIVRTPTVFTTGGVASCIASNAADVVVTKYLGATTSGVTSFSVADSLSIALVMVSAQTTALSTTASTPLRTPTTFKEPASSSVSSLSSASNLGVDVRMTSGGTSVFSETTSKNLLLTLRFVSSTSISDLLSASNIRVSADFVGATSAVDANANSVLSVYARILPEQSWSLAVAKAKKVTAMRPDLPPLNRRYTIPRTGTTDFVIPYVETVYTLPAVDNTHFTVN